MFGILRGPDQRPPEVKAAAARISIGHHACSGLASFFCEECKQSSGIDIQHLPDCSVGKILNGYLASRGWPERNPQA